MRRIRKNLLLTSATLALTVSVGVLNEAPALAQDPNFTEVADILLGRRRLLPVDDLVASLGVGQQGGQIDDQLLFTADSMIASQDRIVVSDDAVRVDTAIGRMFELPNDVVLTAIPGVVDVKSIPDGIDVAATAGLPDPPASIATADFNGDGLVEIVVAYLVDAGSPEAKGLQVATAANVNDVQAGLEWGPFLAIGAAHDLLSPVATGDVNGDGRAEIITAGFNGDSSEIEVAVYTVDPSTLAITRAGSVTTSTAAAGIDFAEIQAGQFAPVPLNTLSSMTPPFVPPDQLALVLGNDPIIVLSIDVSSDFGLTIEDSETISTSSGDTVAGSASGRLAWFGFVDAAGQVQQTEQLVVVTNVGAAGEATMIDVFTFDGDLNIRSGGGSTIKHPAAAGCQALVLSSLVVPQGVAVGNFDQDLAPNGQTFTRAPNLQIGLLFVQACLVGTDIAAVILGTEDPENGNFTPKVLSVHIIAPNLVGAATPVRFAFAAGDLQGRSLLLGPPEVARVSQQHQPDLILGAPPMHVDFITPSGAARPTVFNMSAVPDAFNSAYDTMDKTNDQSSRKSTTSFSYAFRESTAEKVTFGVPDVVEVSEQFKFAAQQTHDSTVSRTFDTYVGRAFNASTATGFGDQLRFMAKRFNIYVYPVIGHEVCPNGQTCPPTSTHPLHVMFSGPDMITRTDINASTVEWYQPIHEPGNVLSYPATADLLDAARKLTNPSFDLMQSALGNTTFFTDTSTQMVSIQWTSGGGSDISVGSSTSYSFDESLSYSASGSGILEGIAIGGAASATFSANQSKAFNTLRSTVETVGASTGVMIDKTGNFANPAQYQYAVDAFIFGEPNPPGTFQTIEQMVDQMTTGPLEVGFTADPTDASAGAWWVSDAPGNYTSAPDVALNHPARWNFTQVGSRTPLPANCILSSQDQMDCMTFNAPPDFSSQRTCPGLSCLWTSEFHWLRGLLITPADADGGPQIGQATAGDALRLRARVYNYSLAEMAEGAQVHVRFYSQQWDQTTNSPTGDSSLIDEVVLPPIPPFSTESLNSVFAETTYDTTGAADQYLVFWVLVWMERNGELVAELPDHGLTRIPGSLTSIADVPIEMHSNNVGFLKSVFYVRPQQAPADTQETAPLVTDVRGGGLRIERVGASPSRATIGEKVEVTALLSTGDAPEDGVTVTFYDGDPLAGGAPFDVELVSHVRADDVYQVRAPFRAATCGTRRIFVVANEGSPFPAEGMTALNVPCERPVVIKPRSGSEERLPFRSL